MRLSQRARLPPAAQRARVTRVNAAAAVTARPRTGPVVKVSFKLPYRCRYGQNLIVVGKGDALGNWEPGEGLQLRWNPGDVWSGEIAIADSDRVELEYKYVVRESDGQVSSWAPGSNFNVQVPVAEDKGSPPDRIDVNDVWDQAWRDIQVIFKDTNLLDPEEQQSQDPKVNVAAAMAKYAERMQSGASEELAILQASMDKALANLSGTMDVSEHLLQLVKDPADPAALEMDRRVAASFNRVMALSKAITATANEPLQLPGNR